jgi:hypothetical protein
MGYRAIRSASLVRVRRSGLETKALALPSQGIKSRGSSPPPGTVAGRFAMLLPMERREGRPIRHGRIE